MDSWTLQGDSYSFLRSAPRTFSLCNRDGTPNHIEIFDIINVPNQRSAISETNCLCDIFGDDKESQSLSSSPAGGTFPPSLREVDGTAAASPLVDDLNESSSSYHTAPGSSEGEEGFEDSREKLCSPTLQSQLAEKKPTEDTILDSDKSNVLEDRSPNLDPKSKSPSVQQSSSSPVTTSLNSSGRTPSSGHNSPRAVCTEERLSSLSYSSVEKGYSTSSLDSKLAEPVTESRVKSPAFKERHSSLSHQSLTPSPSFELTRVSSSLSEPANTDLQKSPGKRKLSLNTHSTASPRVTPEDLGQDYTESPFEDRSIHLSPLPSPYDSESLGHSRESLVGLEFRNTASPSDADASSPLSELGGRVSIPDLLSRGSTPDAEGFPHSPELVLNSPTAVSGTATFSEPAGHICVVSPFTTESTQPSPVILTVSPPDLQSAPSPEFENTVSPVLSSPALCSAASSTKSGASTPSPYPSPKPASPGVRTRLSSPGIDYSLSPSPALSDNCSLTEYRYTSPSPEIRIITSSPEVNREEGSFEIGTPSSPFLDSYSYTRTPISPTSSPHFTDITYSVVQPEDRDSPPFPELSHLSTEDQGSINKSSVGSRNSSERRLSETVETPQGSPHTTDLTDFVEFENTQFRHQAELPLINDLIPSPDLRQQSPSLGKSEIPILEQRGTDLSPIIPFPDQQSSTAFTTNYNPFCKTSARSTPEVESDFPSVNVIEPQFHKPLAQNFESSTFNLCNWDKSGTTDTENHSPVEFNSPVSSSPVFKEEKIYSTQKHEEEENDQLKQDTVQDNLRLPSFPVKTLNTSDHIFQAEDTNSNLLCVTKTTSPNRNLSKDRSPSDTVESLPLFHSLEDLQSEFIPYPRLSESRGLLKPYYTPQISRRHLITSANQEIRTKATDDMSRHVDRRRTPSPPLTRFTPIHIIAPEKPYRHWQNRSHSPSQPVAVPQSGNSNKAATDRECPNVAPVDIYSQQHWVGPERQLEREQQIGQQRDVCTERKRERGMRKERKREERVTEKGEGWQTDASYRGEQVELSFSARNRKGPASCSAAPTSRETRQGLPTVHSSSESVLATRQLQQQQNLLRLASQQDGRGGGARRLRQPQAKNRSTGHLATKRPCRSSSSSMGSELDETDNEVKWFSDLAFSSLSSPEVDYLDMYNSSHRSSTNISQPSTQESPAGAKSPWLSYADFKGSTAKLDQDELSFQHSPAYNYEGLDPSRRYELGSFECVDVAVEREDTKKVRRGVPKRQIQLKRRNAAEAVQDESSENSSPGIPVLAESPFQDSTSRGTFVRQHSTPAVMQECYPTDNSPEQSQHIKSKLQKSSSVEETFTKSKMASHLIKSVLSKKMQSFDKQSDEPGEEDLCRKSEDDSPLTFGADSHQCCTQNLSSSLQSDCSLSSEGVPLKAELAAKEEAKPPRGQLSRPSNRSSSSNSSRSVNFSLTANEDVESQNRNPNLLRNERGSEYKVPFDSDHHGPVLQRVDDNKTHEREDADTANSYVRNTEESSSTAASTPQVRVTNKVRQGENTEDHKQQKIADKCSQYSKRQDIIPKAMENKRASLNVCLTPEAEKQSGTSLPDVPLRETREKTHSCKDETTEDSDESAARAPLHKVRDVRRLVKNTYNLSFKAASTDLPSTVSEVGNTNFREERKGETEVGTCVEKDVGQKTKCEEKEHKLWMEMEDQREEEAKRGEPISPLHQKKGQSPLNPHPMQIQCKAVCWKDDNDKTSCLRKDLEHSHEQTSVSPNSVEVSKESLNMPDYITSDIASDKHHEANSAEVPQTTTEMHKLLDNDDKPVMMRTERKPPTLGSIPKMPSKEREVSTAVVLIREGQRQTNCSTSQIPEEIPTNVDCPPPLNDLSTSGTGGHSVSMLLKEKGYQADIGAVVGDNHNRVGGKLPHKHVNCLEIPLQTNTSLSESSTEFHEEKKQVSAPTVVCEKPETITKRADPDRSEHIKPMEKEMPKENVLSPIRNLLKDSGDFEAVKRLDPTFPPRSPSIRRFKSQSIQATSLSKEPEKQGIGAGCNRPQSIEVKSIAKNSQKPVVPPKPNYKFKPTDLVSSQNDGQRQQAATQAQTIVVSSPTIYRKISNEATTTSNYSKKLAVSAVSSLKPPPHKTASTTVFSLSNKSSLTSDTGASNSRGKQCPQKNGRKTVTLATAPSSGAGPGVTSAPGTATEPKPYPIPDPATAEDNLPSQTAVIHPDNQLQHPGEAYFHEQALPVIPNNTKQPTAVSTTQVPRYSQQQFQRSLSSERSQRADELHFMASDDPPSYDERESFSPLTLPDLTPLRSNRYQPTSRCPQCSCTAGCHTHPGLSAPHHSSPHNLTPPAPPHSPGQALPYPVVQPPLRPHQSRHEPQQISYQPGSPKASPLGQSQPPTMFQPLHQAAPAPIHPSLMQNCPADRSLPPLPQHIEPRRPPVHRSPHQQVPSIAVPSYTDPGHNHSPGLPSIDHQYLCGPQSLGPSYGSEYGGDSSSLYSESSYAQTPRRVLLDPETGKYFYIEVPVQPLRKMLFDPETGQYVEVLIPQQAMSHSGLYPPAAAPYPTLHNSNMYAPAPQYMPYTAPPPSAHPQPPLQPPRYPEASVATTMHPPGLGYRNPPGQGTKPDPQNHPPLDHGYLESMYYVPTGMNASPNPTPPDYYHKHPPNLPPTGGKRS